MLKSLSTAPPKNATYADLVALPEHLVGEILNGELIASPRPAAPHATATSVLGMDIGSPFQRGRGGPGGWWIMFEPELHFNDDVLVPDLAGWRKERMPEVPNQAWFDLPPDWICEVVSPSTARIDRIRKMPIYARPSVSHAWLVDPLQRTLEVFRLQEQRWVVIGNYEGNVTVRAESFDVIELELGALWLPEVPAQPTDER
ncbi:MAG: Uma2 family endonuclease [Myxococcales bacterium]|nr:MAG: Uma2 family endonuclease [Myxococcales bacterium]